MYYFVSKQSRLKKALSSNLESEGKRYLFKKAKMPPKKHTMSSKVKQEWRECTPYGEPISINEKGFKFKFIAFKVPFSRESGWSLEKMVEDFPDLSLLIDLCATDKYYRLEDLETLKPDAQFKKIKVTTAVPEDATVNE